MVTEVPIEQNLSKRLREDKKFRKLYFRTRNQRRIASGIRRLRAASDLRQSDLIKKCRMKQSAISRIEQADYASWTYKTLLRVTEALDGVLEISIRAAKEVIDQYEKEEKQEEQKALEGAKSKLHLIETVTFPVGQLGNQDEVPDYPIQRSNIAAMVARKAQPQTSWRQ